MEAKLWWYFSSYSLRGFKFYTKQALPLWTVVHVLGLSFFKVVPLPSCVKWIPTIHAPVSFSCPLGGRATYPQPENQHVAASGGQTYLTPEPMHWTSLLLWPNRGGLTEIHGSRLWTWVASKLGLWAPSEHFGGVAGRQNLHRYHWASTMWQYKALKAERRDDGVPAFKGLTGQWEPKVEIKSWYSIIARLE